MNKFETIETTEDRRGVVKTAMRRANPLPYVPDNYDYVTDYERAGVVVRVVETGCENACGRENATVRQIAPTCGRLRTYKHVGNAHAAAYEMVIEATR